MKKIVFGFMFLAALGVNNVCSMNFGPEEQLAAAIVEEDLIYLQNALGLVSVGDVNKNLAFAALNDNTDNMDILQALLAVPGVNINSRNGQSESILHILVKRMKNDFLKSFINNHNPDLTALDKNHNNVLHIAAEYNNHEAADIILESITDVIEKKRLINALNSNGQTPFNVFCSKYTSPLRPIPVQNEDFVQCLMSHGAEIELEDLEGVFVQDGNTVRVQMTSPESQAVQESMTDVQNAQLSQYEIDNSKQGQISNDSTFYCAICLEDKDTKVQNMGGCNHSICSDCFIKSELGMEIDLGGQLKVIRKCPFCREMFYVIVEVDHDGNGSPVAKRQRK